MCMRASQSVVCILLITVPASAQTVWYVDDGGDTENGCTSWADACLELQTALSLTEAGDQIWVAAGTYKPDYDVATGKHTGDRGAAFELTSGVGVYGGFDGTEGSLEDRAGLFDQTILSGDLDGDDTPVGCMEDSADCDSFGRLCINNFCIISDNNAENSYHVVIGSGTDAATFLEGFTISAGNADGIGPDGEGGGLRNESGNLTVANCTFMDNTANAGGGMANRDGSNPKVFNCDFSHNSASSIGGGIYNASSHPTVTNSTFIENSSRKGGGMYNTASSLTLTNCTFIGNLASRDFDTGNFATGGGLQITGANPTVTNCAFIGNSASDQGGGMYNQSSAGPTVINCTFSGNVTTGVYGGGGGMGNRGSTPTLTNCTFSGNSAGLTGGGGILNIFTGYLTLNNCILWGNVPDQSSGAPQEANYSIVQGGWVWAGGIGMLDIDPLFVGPLGPDNIPGTRDDDLRLISGSPAIDAGNNAAVPKGITTDLDGNPRFVDDPNSPDCPQPDADCGDPPIVDMGAYEFRDPCADDDGDGRLTICHSPPGNLSNAHTIIINIKALPGHLAHGDHCGPCEDGGG